MASKTSPTSFAPAGLAATGLPRQDRSGRTPLASGRVADDVATSTLMNMKPFLSILLAATTMFLAGCATSTVESRRTERMAAYNSLPEDQRALVDLGQVRVGMNQDAVYIAWGAPQQKTQAEDGQGLSETWVYSSSTLDTYNYWTFRERTDRQGRTYLDRVLETDSQINSYVSAEITFADGKVKSWRTFPTPPSRSGFRPGY
jgi:outer membrane protein assembly factor BamE (lipoprotein component of BamABCDE complex)